MAWIKTIGFHDPDLHPELIAAYQAAGAGMPPDYKIGGGTDAAEIVKSHSLDPTALRLMFSAGGHLIAGPSPLSRREREMINTAVSTANRCFY
jgi:carboxymuconolactone decarboxylase family protein